MEAESVEEVEKRTKKTRRIKWVLISILMGICGPLNTLCTVVEEEKNY